MNYHWDMGFAFGTVVGIVTLAILGFSILEILLAAFIGVPLGLATHILLLTYRGRRTP